MTEQVNEKKHNSSECKTFPTHEMPNTCSAMQLLCAENNRRMSTSSACQNLPKPLESFDFFLIPLAHIEAA